MTVPVISSINPAVGSTAGGTVVSIVGTDLHTATAVFFGAEPASTFASLSSTLAVAQAPPGSGSVHITLTTSGGTSAETGADMFTYGPTVLFSEVEARTFDKLQLSSDSYADAVISAGEERIREAFTNICRVHFVPTSSTVVLDGVDSETIRLPFRNPLKEQPPRGVAITAATIDGVALTATELADLACYPDGKIVRKSLGSWSGRYNYRNVSITCVHGWSAVPTEVKLAALTLLVYQLVPSNLSDRVTSWSDGSMTYAYSYAGTAPHWFGIPFVDGVLERYREDRTVIA